MSKLWLLVKVDTKRLLSFKKNNKNIIGKILLAAFIIIASMLTIGVYVSAGLHFLRTYNMEKYIIAGIYIITAFIIFYTTIYRSKSYLFSTDDTIFSMPIKPSVILASKLISLTIVSCLINFLICIPAFIVYGTTLNLGFMFYLMAFIATIFLPLVPTILGALFGYIIGYITSKSKNKKIIEVIFTYGFIFLVMFLSFNIQNIGMQFVNNAEIVDKFLNTAGFLINSLIIFVTEYNIIHLLIYIITNILAVVIFSAIFQKSYTRVVQNLKVVKGSKKKYIVKEHNKKSKFITMLIKEIKFYFSIPIYVFNTSIGAIFVLIAAFATIFFDVSSVLSLLEIEGLNISMFLMLILAISFMVVMTSTSAVSLSLEGKNFWILKTLPVRAMTIFMAKILLNMLVILPATYFAIVIFIFTLKITIIEALILASIATLLSFTFSMFGIIINLKYPNLNFISYTHAVKQSFSSFLGMMIPLMLMILIMFLYGGINIAIETFLIIACALLLLVNVVQYFLLKNWGVKKFNELN